MAAPGKCVAAAVDPDGVGEASTWPSEGRPLGAGSPEFSLSFSTDVEFMCDK